MNMPLLLRPPCVRDEAALRRIHEQLRPDGFNFLPIDGSWEEFLAFVAREATGVGNAPDRVKSDFLVAEVRGIPVGRVSIRHNLNDDLFVVGGHVGYAVGPDHRSRGYAKEMLRQSVSRLRSLGVEEVLLTCNHTNRASISVIEACGGHIEDIRTIEGGQICRYWITG